jgi:hypothetical protein
MWGRLEEVQLYTGNRVAILICHWQFITSVLDAPHLATE